MARIERAVFDAVVQSEAHQVDVFNPVLLQVLSKSGVPAMGVVEKRAVTINVSFGAFVKNMRDAACVEFWGEIGAVHVLNTVHRPENLFDAVENDPVPRLFAWVICGKAAVIARMPILRGDDEIEAPLQFICNRNDLIAMRYRQGAGRHEIILKVDED